MSPTDPFLLGKYVSRENLFPIGAGITLEQLEGDPHPHLTNLRSNEPVSWLPAFRGWLVTGRDLAIETMLDSETFTVDDPRFSTGQVVGPSMLSLDGAEHTRHRTPFLEPLRPADLHGQMTEAITHRAQALVSGIKDQGHADLASQYAAPLAAGVMSDLLGLDRVDSASLVGWYDDIVDAVDAVTAGKKLPKTGVVAYQTLKKAIESTIRPDSLPSLIRVQGHLTSEEVASNMAILLFGGIVTSEGTTSTLLHQLLSNPEQLKQVRRDRSLVGNAVDEALRYEPAAAVVDRYATADASVGDVRIDAGDLVRISLSAPNRDPGVFEEPDRFDVTRPNAGAHLTFARGPHICLGIHLARLETATALEVVLDELPGIELDPETTRGPAGLIFRGPQAVGATWPV